MDKNQEILLIRIAMFILDLAPLYLSYQYLGYILQGYGAKTTLFLPFNLIVPKKATAHQRITLKVAALIMLSLSLLGFYLVFTIDIK